MARRLVTLQWIAVVAAFGAFALSWSSMSFGWRPVWLDPLVAFLMLLLAGSQVYVLRAMRRQRP